MGRAGRIIAMAIMQTVYGEKFLPTHPELIRDLGLRGWDALPGGIVERRG